MGQLLRRNSASSAISSTGLHRLCRSRTIPGLVPEPHPQRNYMLKPNDKVKLTQISPKDCPRKYCWWWRTLAFDWEISAAEGCTFLEAARKGALPNYAVRPDLPCCRADSSSEVDHYDPQDPYILEDGVDDRWLNAFDERR